jgi:hypothetical protein
MDMIVAADILKNKLSGHAKGISPRQVKQNDVGNAGTLFMQETRQEQEETYPLLSCPDIVRLLAGFLPRRDLDPDDMRWFRFATHRINFIMLGKQNQTMINLLRVCRII